ncbi:MAG: mechanosensitive ion channel, partial [Candidatus Heimdallarchaeota archaeon]|nr:mechanosensitive ion channel [Candidatus Heimdallarchaeota archaeon]
MRLQTENYDTVPVFLKNFIETWGYFSIGDWEIPFMGLLMLVVSLIAIYLLSKLFTKIFTSRISMRGLSPDMFNALRFFLKIFVAFIIAYLFTFLLNIDPKYIALVSGVIATAISFASMKATNNFIAGVWITLTRPFHVGDYIKIGSTEGLVVEISLNYTKVMFKQKNVTMIPNIQCLKSNIINYTISITWFAKQIAKLENQIVTVKRVQLKKKKTDEKGVINLMHLEQKLTRLKSNYTQMTAIQQTIEERKSVMNKIHSKYVDDERIVRYTFDIALARTPQRNKRLLEEICEKWTKEFEIMPTFKILGMDAH